MVKPSTPILVKFTGKIGGLTIEQADLSSSYGKKARRVIPKIIGMNAEMVGWIGLCLIHELHYRNTVTSMGRKDEKVGVKF